VVTNQPLSDEESTQLIVCQYPEEEEGDGVQASHLEEVPADNIHIAPSTGACSPDIKVSRSTVVCIG
jgi:hypothetical protein